VSEASEPEARIPLPEAGVIPPLVTPMLPDHTPDLDSLDSLIDHVLSHGATGVLVLGSTGENGLLSSEQRYDVAAHVIAAFSGRTHVMIGVPAMGLSDARVDARAYATLGAASLLVPAPYGFAYSHCELADYFRELKALVRPTPIVAYNVPSRVGINLEPDFVAELAADEAISGLKDSSGNLEAHRVIAQATASVTGFKRYTGSELSIDAALLAGFHGAVPGLANVFVRHHVALANHAAAGNWAAAARMQGDLATLARLYQAPRGRASFTAAAIGALKEALVQLGIIAYSTVSRPLHQPDDGLRAHVAELLAEFKEFDR
jgi:4-hydroxy-tetrahydrodipicolinate synthase